MKSIFDYIVRVIGASTVAFVIMGALDLIDFHVCIKDAGQCKIISIEEYNQLKGEAND